MEEDEEDVSLLVNLPKGFKYSNCKKIGSDKLQLHCSSLTDKAEIDKWVKSFGQNEYVEWRIARTYPHLKSVKCHYRIDYRCQHSSSWYESKTCSSRKSKGIQCPAQLSIKIVTLSKYDCGTTTLICLMYKHNHSCQETAGLLKYRSVSTETQECLKELLASGHSPLGAYQILKSDAFIQFPEEYDKIADDRNKIPSISYCYNLFYKEFKEKFGNLRSDAACQLAKLKHQLWKWNNTTGGSVSVGLSGNELIISIITPLMKRIRSKLPHSREVIYVDSSIHCDRRKRRSYFFYTNSVCGMLPLGYIIVADIKTDTFEASLRQYSELEGGDVDYTDPDIIVIENDFAEGDVIKNVWPCSNILLSSTYVLRTVWQWIVDPHHRIPTNDRSTLFLAFKKILRAQTINDALQFYAELMESDLARKYKKFCLYIQTTWWPINDSWCLYSRCDLFTKNYYAEFVMRTLKDIVLKQTKVYDIPQLVDFIVTRFDKYYSQRMIDFINGHFSSSNLKNFLPDCRDVSLDRVVLIDDDTYLVQNLDKEDYVVDLAVGICTCFAGLSGRLCKHQCAILLSMKMTIADDLYDKSNRQLLFSIVTGEEAPKEWFDKDNIFIKQEL